MKRLFRFRISDFGFRITGVSTPQSTIRNPQWKGGELGRDERGFTLLELVVVMALISVVAILSAELINFETHLYTTSLVRGELLQTSRMALHRMIREIMEADSVVSAEVSSFRFFDPDTTDITFALSGSQVVRISAPDNDPLLDHVASLTYGYQGSTGDSLAIPVAAPSSIRRVEISMAVTHLGESITLQSGVYLRRIGE